MKKDLQGLIPAVVIPLNEDYEIDEGLMRKYLSSLASFGIKGLAVNTDAGESHFLVQDERRKVLSIAKETVKDKVPVICGLGGANTFQAEEFAREFGDLGADYFLVFPQICFRGKKGKDTLIIKYYEEIAKIGVPIIIFQLQEALGGAVFDFETLKELVEIDQVVAIKEASFDALRFKETAGFLKSLKKRITILTGNDNFILESFLLGADGALIGFGSIFTDIQVEAIRLAKEGKFNEASASLSRIEEICRKCFSEPIRDYRSRIKEVLVAQGIFRNSLVRPPLIQISEDEREELHRLVAGIS